MLTFTLLGQVLIARDGAPLDRFRSRKEAALLIYLAHTGRAQPREHLADLLWDSHSTKQSLANLRTALTRLREKVSDELIVDHRSVALAPHSRPQVDSATLLLALAAVGRVDSAATAATLQNALAAYQGDFLADFYLTEATQFNEWLAATRQHIRRQVATAYDRLGHYALAAGDAADGITIANRWLQVDAFNETAHTLLIQSLLKAGRAREAVDHYNDSAEQLQTELGIAPPAKMTALIQDVQLKRAPLPRPPATVRHNLPSETDQFFGRHTIRQEIHARLDQPWCRLVTLVGQGGAGKTRLAVTVARDRLRHFRDGVWLVELADVAADDDDLAEAMAVEIATTLDLRLSGSATPIEQLLSHLQHKEMLLVLDNFEHLLEGLPLVLNLIQRCEGVKLLITSREALNVRAEWTVALTGLAFPSSDMDDRPTDAVELFLARQAQQQPGEVAGAELPAVRAICRLVEGLPLAIELAAALTRHTPPQQVADNLRAGFDTLTSALRDMPARHRGLRVVFEMSWRALTPALQERLARLAFFAGGFTPDAAQQVAQTDADQLAALAEKSLLTPHAGPDAAIERYSLHPVIRAYAAEKRRPTDPTPQQHAGYYLALLAHYAAPLQERAPQHAVAALEPDIDNVRLAWPTALAAPTAEAGPAADRLAGALAPLSVYYQLRGLAHEGEAVMRATAGAAAAWPAGASAGHTGLSVAARAGLEQARFQNRLGRHRPAIQTLQTALPRAAQSGDRWAEGMGHVLWGEALWRLGDYSAAQSKLDHALALSRALDATVIAGWCHHHLGIIGDIQGQYAAAREHLAQACTAWRTIDNAQALSGSLNSIGLVAYHQGDRAAAQEALEQALALCNQLDNRHHQSALLNNLSIIAIEQGDLMGAQYYLHLGLELATTSGNLINQGEIYTNLGKNYRLLGELALSVDSLSKGLHIAETLENRSLLATATLSLANTRNAAGEEPEAEALYRQALAVAQQDNLRSTACEALIGLAELLGRCDPRQAKRYSTQALALAEALQMPQLLERARAVDDSLRRSG